MRYFLLFFLLFSQSVLAAGFPTNCSTALTYATSTNAYGCNSLASGINLGTSASATNPQKSGDATTGLFSAAASTVSVATAGVERLQVDASGNTSLVSAAGSSVSSPILNFVGYNSTGVAKTPTIQNVFDVPNNQNKLLINGPAGTAFSSMTFWNSGVIYITGTAELNTQVTRVQNSFLGFNLLVPIGTGFQALVARGVASQSADIFQVQNSGTTALFNVTASGSVGIGSSIPGSKLDINAGGNTDVNIWTTSGYNILSMNGGLTAAAQTGIESGATGDDSLYVNAGNSGNIIFRTSGQVEKVRIVTSTGFVGIGSNNPRSILDISQSTGAIILPIGTTGQEPSAVEGMLRDNSTLKFLEGYINGIWAQLFSGSNGTPTCGTGCASITAGSTDARGSATSGTLATSVIVNFSVTLPYTPFCAAAGSSTAAVVGCVATTSALTCSLSTGLTGDVITWHCPQ